MIRKAGIFLLVLMLFLQLCACTNTPLDRSGDTQTVNVEKKSPVPEDADFGEVDVKILVRSESVSDSQSGGYKTTDFYAEDNFEDILNIAIYKRNLAVSERLNINLIVDTSSQIDNALQQAVMSGEQDYDFYSLALRSAYAMISNDYLLSLNDLPYVDFSRPWWMTDAMQDSSIGSKNYFAVGDMSLNAYMCAGAVFFSKNLIEENSLESPYQLVYDGTWTVDKMLEMSKTATRELNGDEVMNERDAYGLACNTYMWEPLFAATGLSFTSKDENDYPVYVSPNERVMDCLQRIRDICNDESTFFAEDKYSYLTDHRAYPTVMFAEDRALFNIEVFYGIMQYSTNENDFGFVPIPKWDESQEKYYTVLHNTHARGLVIQGNVLEDKYKLYGCVLEELGYQSNKIVYPEFVTKMLGARLSRDEDSSKMVDYLTSSLRVDIMLSDRIGTLNSDIRNILKNPHSITLSSMFAANENKYINALEGITAKIRGK